ncbi:MAG: FAD-dependent oxidoreductase [Nitrospinota bacterium]
MPNSENEIVDITIIGGGPVGLYGAYYAGLRESSVRIIDSLPELGGRLMALYPEKYVYDVAGFPKIYAKELISNLIEQVSQYKPLIDLGEKVTGLAYNGEDKTYTLITDKNNRYKSRTVIIVAGVGAFVPKKLDVKGIAELEGSGIYYFAKDLNIFKNKRVTIVGGGDSAVDWALTLEKQAKQVTLLHRLGRFQAHEDSVDKLLKSSVEVKFPYYEIKEVHGDDKVEAITYFNSKTGEEQYLETDALLLNIGFLANLGPISEWGLEIEKNSIKVNHKMETNLPGVYAAGDIVTHPGKIKLISTGAGEVAIAVNVAKSYLDPTAKVQPGHSSHQKKKKKVIQPEPLEKEEETRSRNVSTAQTYSGYEIIKIAMEGEKDGINFYRKMLENTSSPKAKEVFQYLCHEEEKHWEHLENNLLPDFRNGKIDLKDEELVVAYLKRVNKAEILPEGEDIEKITDGLTHDFEAVRVAIDIEKKAVLFYEKMFEATRESEGKEVLKKIVDQEKNHVGILRKLQADIMNQT